MAIQQVVSIDLNLVGDGTSTVFTYSFTQLFGFTFDTPNTLMNPNVVPSSVAVSSVSSTFPSCIASLDSFGNLILTFSSAPANGVVGQVVVQLFFASGTLAGIETAWTTATAANSTLPISVVGNGTCEVSFNVTGTLSAGRIVLEVSDNGSDWYPIPGISPSTYSIFTDWQPTYGNTVSYQINCAGYNNFRLRLATVLTGSGSVDLTIQPVTQPLTAVTSVVQQYGPNLHMVEDQGPPQSGAGFVQPRKLTTYRAVYRLNSRPYALSNAFTAGSRKQFATIHHPATSAKTVKIRHAWVAIESSSVASIITAELRRITSAPSGGTAITSQQADVSDVNADSTCLALPTSQGTEGGLFAMHEWNLGVTGSAPTTNPPAGLNWIDLMCIGTADTEDFEAKIPTIRPNTIEGWAVTLDSSGASTVKGFVVIEFTEE